MTFSEVYYIPEMRANILSTKKLRGEELFYQNERQILIPGTVIIARDHTHQKVPQMQPFNIRVDCASNLAMKSHILPDYIET